jgi:hypothetical protein
LQVRQEWALLPEAGHKLLLGAGVLADDDLSDLVDDAIWADAKVQRLHFAHQSCRIVDQGHILAPKPTNQKR